MASDGICHRKLYEYVFTFGCAWCVNVAELLAILLCLYDVIIVPSYMTRFSIKDNYLYASDSS